MKTTDTQATQIPAGEHEMKTTITVDVFIPNHPDRSESPIFRAARKLLIGDNPNARCEVDNEDCDHEHPLELHHDIVEWCDADGIDWDKMKVLYPTFNWSTFDPAHPEMFVDSAFNAHRVLCKKHHTGKDHGIHLLPYPVWLMQKHKRKDFILTPDEEK